MNSTIIYVGLAYIAGMATYDVIETHEASSKLDAISSEIMIDDSPRVDTSVAAFAGSTCACENDIRYNVERPTSSENYPISHVDQCQLMVRAGNPGEPPVAAGAWFSKISLDLMFCHMTNANGIYVYKALNGKSDTYIIEAARKDDILTQDDGISHIYYSRTMCPNDCGECGW